MPREQSSGLDQIEDLAFCRGLFDEIIRIIAPADSSSLDPGHVIGALEFMKDNGDIHPEVVVDLQDLLSKVSNHQTSERYLFEKKLGPLTNF